MWICGGMFCDYQEKSAEGSRYRKLSSKVCITPWGPRREEKQRLSMGIQGSHPLRVRVINWLECCHCMNVVQVDESLRFMKAIGVDTDSATFKQVL
jgi:hypothetical protein